MRAGAKPTASGDPGATTRIASDAPGTDAAGTISSVPLLATSAWRNWSSALETGAASFPSTTATISAGAAWLGNAPNAGSDPAIFTRLRRLKCDMDVPVFFGHYRQACAS